MFLAQYMSLKAQNKLQVNFGLLAARTTIRYMYMYTKGISMTLKAVDHWSVSWTFKELA